MIKNISKPIYLILIICFISVSCLDSNEKRDSNNSEKLTSGTKKLYRKTEMERLEIYEYIEKQTNDREWLVADRNHLRRICKTGLSEDPDKQQYCNCALDYLESKVEVHYIYSLSVNTLGFILGKITAVHCQ